VECKFVVGQKVVCIKEFARSEGWCPAAARPVVGNVYTITGIEPGVHHPGVFLELAELAPVFCKCRGATLTVRYEHLCFKPLEHSGMEILRKIAANPPSIEIRDNPAEPAPARKRKKETV